MNMFLVALPSLVVMFVEIALMVYCIRTLYLIRKEQLELMKKLDKLIEKIES